jgi:hypothetical protein
MLILLRPARVLPVGSGTSRASEVRGFLQTKQLQEIAAKELKVNKWSSACVGLAGNRLFWGSKSKGKKEHNPCYMKIRFFNIGFVHPADPAPV